MNLGVDMDRSAYRRLDRSLWQAENRLQEWGRIVRHDRAPCDWPSMSPIYRAMRSADPWLESARRDPVVEPEWFRDMVELVREQPAVVQTFMRRRWVDGLTTEQARSRLNMSASAAARVVRDVRYQVHRRFGFC